MAMRSEFPYFDTPEEIEYTALEDIDIDDVWEKTLVVQHDARTDWRDEASKHLRAAMSAMLKEYIALKKRAEAGDGKAEREMRELNRLYKKIARLSRRAVKRAKDSEFRYWVMKVGEDGYAVVPTWVKRDDIEQARYEAEKRREEEIVASRKVLEDAGFVVSKAAADEKDAGDVR